MDVDVQQTPSVQPVGQRDKPRRLRFAPTTEQFRPSFAPVTTEGNSSTGATVSFTAGPAKLTKAQKDDCAKKRKLLPDERDNRPIPDPDQHLNVEDQQRQMEQLANQLRQRDELYEKMMGMLTTEREARQREMAERDRVDTERKVGLT